MESLEAIKGIIQSVLDKYAAELVDLKVNMIPGGPVIRVLVDKKEKPNKITIGECIAINKELRSIFAKNENIHEEYELEVSSPGLDRQLVAGRDFERVLGQEVNIFTSTPVNGKSFFVAEVISAQKEAVSLKTKNGEMLNIPYSNIQKSNLVIKF